MSGQETAIENRQRIDPTFRGTRRPLLKAFVLEESMFTRRSFLLALSQTPLLGAATGKVGAGEPGSAGAPRAVYHELGVPTFINAGEPFTSLSGAPVRPEVKAAMQLASTKFVRFVDAQKAVGEHLASLLGCEAAMVTTGAGGALTLGTAACMTGSDVARIRRLPDSTGMPNEAIIQKAHRYQYEQAVRICGTKMIEVETSEQLKQTIGPRSALLLFNNRWTAQGRIRHPEFVAIGKSRGVPTFIDCASDAPPAENLTKFNKLGFDLVTFSGGKGLRAPASTGLLMGRRDLIEAAKRNSAPHDETIGRGMKLNKDELVGLLVAVESCLQDGSDSAFAASERTLQRMGEEMAQLEGVRVEVFRPPVSYSWPHLRIQWDEGERRVSADQAREKLLNGRPPIVTRTGPDPVIGLELSAWMLSAEETQIVVRRVTDVLTGIS